MHQEVSSFLRRSRSVFQRPSVKRDRRRGRVQVEVLEDRRLLAATLGITAGTLSFSTAGSAMNLSVSVDSGGVYTLHDPSQTIALGSGVGAWTLSSDQHTATGPAASFTQLAIIGDSGSHNDAVSILSTNAPTSINTGAGDDVFNFTAQAITSAVALTNPLSNGSDGDTVNFLTGGGAGTLATGQKGRESYQAAGAGLINVTSVKSNFVDSFQGLSSTASTLSLDLNSLYAAPTALATTLSMVGGQVNVAVTNVPTRQFPDGSIAGFTIQGTTGGNALTIDYANGIPYGASVAFTPPTAGGAAQNAMTLKNGSFAQEAYIASGAGAGSIVFPNRVVNSISIINKIDFERLTPITDTVTVGGFTFTSPLGNQTVNVVAGPVVSGTQTTQINDGGTSNFELINLANKTSVTINTGAGSDVVALNLATPAVGLTTMSVATSGGNDSVTLVASAASVTTRIDVGAGTNQIDLSNAGSLAGVQGPVFAKATGGTSTLKLDDTAGVAVDSFTIAPGQVSGGPLGASVDYSGGGITTVEIRGGLGADTFTFTNFGSPTTAEIYNIAGGAGNDKLVINSSLPNVDFATPGVLNFGGGQPTVNYTSIEQITLNVSSSPPTGVPVTITTTEARSFVLQTVARFTDAAPNGTVDYFASINWGDGTPVSGGFIVPAGVTGSYEILGNHLYAAAATYPVTVTLTRQGGASSGTTIVGGVPITVNGGSADNTTIDSTAVVHAAPLSAQGVPLAGRATAPLSSSAGGIQVATFTDSGTNLPPTGYTALIYWGDGSAPTPATQITSSGTAGGVVYHVFGEHTYANLGTYPVTVLITKPPVAVPAPATPQPPPGAQAVAVATATILDAPLRNVTAQLNPASDSGASNTDGITNIRQPNYFGLTDSPGATVAVVAMSASGAPTLLGATQADNAGSWNVTSTVSLPDGAYTITVFAADHFNGDLSLSIVLPQTLVIDTVGPKVTNAVFTPNSGFVEVFYQDYGGADNAGSGVNLATVQDPSNYAFAFVSTTVRGYKPPARWLIGPITTTPGTTVGPQAAQVLINGGTPIRGGIYQLKITSASAAARAGVQDVAGNALDGEFYGTFPSGNNLTGGDFVVRLDSIHNRVFAPQTTVGPAKPKPPVRTPVRPPVRTPPVRTPPVRTPVVRPRVPVR